MPVRAGISAECLIEILTDPEAGFQDIEDGGEWADLMKDGILPSINLRRAEWLGYTEMTDWVEHSEIGWPLFGALREKYCPSSPR